MLRIEGAVAKPVTLTLDDLRNNYPANQVETSYANDVRVAKSAFTGVRLWDLLQSAGVQINAEHHEAMQVTACSADGFECSIQWQEFDPDGDNKLILVAYLQNEQPIQSPRGPLRLVVPGDTQGQRYIGNLTTLIVVNNPISEE